MIDPWTIQYVRIPKGQLCGLWLITKPPSPLWAGGLSYQWSVSWIYHSVCRYSRFQLSADNNWFRVILHCDWSRNHAHVNQSDAKLKLITTWSPIFSRALGSLFGFTLSSHWLFKLFSFFLIGCCDFFGVDFTTLCREALYCDFRLWYTIFCN